MDPRQQAATLKTLHRQHLIGWIPTLFTLLFTLFLQSRRLGGLAYLHRAWVEETRKSRRPVTNSQPQSANTASRPSSMSSSVK